MNEVEEKISATLETFEYVLAGNDQEDRDYVAKNEYIIKSWINRLKNVQGKHGNISIVVKNGMILKRIATPDGGHFESLE